MYQVGCKNPKRKEMKYKVQFSVRFEVEVECEPNELYDEISELNIPEDAETRYVGDTFEVEKVLDDKGEVVELFQE